MHLGCGTCMHFSVCSHRQVKNVKSTTDYCQWETDRYQEGTNAIRKKIGLDTKKKDKIINKSKRLDI